MNEYSEKELLYSAAIESSDDAILTKTLDGIITSWNPAAEKLYGYTEKEVIGKSVDIIVPPEMRNEIRSILAQIKKGRRVDHHETTRFSRVGKPIHVSLTVSPIKNPSGEILGASAIARDITERKMLEEFLKNQNIESFPVLIDADPKIVWITDSQGNFIDYLESRSNLSARTFEEREKLFHETVHPDDLHSIKEFKNRVIKYQTPNEMEFRCWGGDGEWRWASMLAVPLMDEKASQNGWIGLKLDITRQKKMVGLFVMQLSKTTKQLRHLAIRSNSKVESESQRIAIEVHDQVGGNLIEIKHDLERIKAETKDFFEQENNCEMKKRLDQTLALVVKTIAAVKKISSELHPAELDYLGLVAAIKSEAESFSNRFGISCEFNFEIEETSLNKEQELAAFRVFQELLRNIRRHANADKINIRLTQGDDNFRLSVEDNGRGITETEKKAEKSLGLLGMKERIQHVGGTFEIKGVEGLGTTATIAIQLPINTGISNEVSK
jgi:PAS domain S-box-containing protein